MPCVYVIAWSPRGPSKVGKANNIPDRLASLQVACPYRLRVWGGIKTASEDDALILEADCHAALNKFALLGEWFRTSPKHAGTTLKAIAQSYFGNVQAWTPTPDEIAARARALAQTKRSLSPTSAAAIRRQTRTLDEARELHAELGGRRWS